MFPENLKPPVLFAIVTFPLTVLFANVTPPLLPLMRDVPRDLVAGAAVPDEAPTSTRPVDELTLIGPLMFEPQKVIAAAPVT